ncbi:HAD-IIIC family phosphatase [Streptomyces lancefieldiae]|uniref:HAD-IIIC family phosphatase n=1 Tax=Streptomyces lancefieldiae TaxID=3075520 RepID=A0ABU3APW1_9ACTN|nr:HAD-IIIC family phosphatase [Streptomyces sp. DSM 40712]MDT0612234.1 HAD-IIIC family phosphatase [Streptomyces sp. DSM 40712]
MADQTVPVKCLVWDLDNTLWRGTLLEGDDIRLPDAVREVIVTLDSRGILQSVASKNDHAPTWRELERLGVAEYFLLPEIGWGPKSESVRRIAEELRFAHTAVAFVDDQPAERAEVAFHLPEVRCYSHEQVLDLPGLPEFTPSSVTEDSRQRRHMYQANFRRTAERSVFTGPDEDFLRSLELIMRITAAGPDDLARVEELTLRTSQMNATGVHYSDSVLRELCADPAHDVLVISMADRFGPHGAVGVLLLARNAGFWHLKLLATSCRVVSFGAGAVLLNWLIDRAFEAGVHLVADFRPTERNRMMEIAYRFAGFTTDPCACASGHGSPTDPDIQRLHLIPDHRNEPDTMRLVTEGLLTGR